MDRFLTGRQVDERLGISRVTRWKLIKEGRLPPPRRLIPNGHQKFSEKEIDAVIKSAKIVETYKDCEYRAVVTESGDDHTQVA